VILFFLIALTLLEIFFHFRIDDWPAIVLWNIVALTTYCALNLIVRRRHATTTTTYAELALWVMAIFFIYQEMGRVIHMITPMWFDGQINALEKHLLRCYPTVWLQSFIRPWLTEIMMALYLSFSVLIPTIGVVSFKRGKSDGLERYLTEMAMAIFLCFLFYVLIPVAGPSRCSDLKYTVELQGYIFTDLSNYIKNNVHLNGGAFPSAHCGASTIMLVSIYRHCRSLRHMFTVLIILIFVSTVYGRFHYITDVVAGVCVAVLVLWFSPKFRLLINQSTVNLGIRVPKFIRWE
jgi:membrane-associated phospholipid phosphatase